MPELHLIRHGRSAPDKSRPASQWPLHTEAEHGLAELRRSGAVPAAGRWFSSPEPKTLGTARVLTATSVGVVDGLREMNRPVGWVDEGGWVATVRRSMTDLDDSALPGWETGRATATRVTGAVERLRESCPGVALVLVGHGTAWTLLVADLTGKPPDLDAWERMTMPDHCALEISDGRHARMLAPWGAWRS